MTMTPEKRTRLMALGVMVFMSVAFVAMMVLFALSIERSTHGAFPMGYVLLTMIMPVVALILIQHLARITVAMIYAHHRIMQEKVPKDCDVPKDPFLTWLSIIFSKEDDR